METGHVVMDMEYLSMKLILKYISRYQKVILNIFGQMLLIFAYFAFYEQMKTDLCGDFSYTICVLVLYFK